MDLPPLRDVIKRHGLSARKSLGQNFLLDLNLTARIARAAGPLDETTIVEIGPGPGGLTRALLALGAKRVIAIERDERALGPLEEIAARYPRRVDIVCADAMDFDLRSRLADERAKIVANLPYNIATPLLIGWLSTEPWPPWFDMMVLMFQREVAERIVAQADDDAYGRLGVLANWRCGNKDTIRHLARCVYAATERHFLGRAPAAARASRTVRPPHARTRHGGRVQPRRKMLRQSLKGLGVDPALLCAAAGVDPTRRAETVPISGFVAMARQRRYEAAKTSPRS